MLPRRGRGRGRGRPPQHQEERERRHQERQPREQEGRPARQEQLPLQPSTSREISSPTQPYAEARPSRLQESRPARQQEARPTRQEPLPSQLSTSHEITSPTLPYVEVPHHQVAPSQAIEPTTKSQRKKEKPVKVQPSDLGLEFKQKLTLQTPFPRNPGPGRLGRRIKLISNCYKIDIPTGYVYHYDVEIVSKRFSESETTGPAKDKKYRCMSTKRNREIINLMLQVKQEFRNIYAAYDGRKNLYTRNQLRIADGSYLKLDVVMEDDDSQDRDAATKRSETFEVTIQPTKKQDTNSCAINLEPLHALFEGKTNYVPQDAIMALETVLRHGPCLKYIPIGRSFYYPPSPDDVHPLGGGRDIWFGYHQSMRLGQWPMVNIDISATTFYKSGPVIDFIAEILHQNPEALRKIPTMRDADIARLTKELKNMRIEATHLKYPRKYRVIKLTRENASQLEFPLTINGQTIRKRVKDYFKEKYNLMLTYPNLPCLQVGPESKKVYLPLEVCKISEGQHCKKKLAEQQNAEMIKFTARSPRDRFSEIRDIVRQADLNSDDIIRHFGMHVYNEPLKLEGRVLEAPNMLYDGRKQIKPRDGMWNMMDTKFFQGADIPNWVLLSFSNHRFCPDHKLNNFASLLCKIANESGIRMNKPQHIEIVDSRRIKIQQILERMKQTYKADLVIIVVPATNKEVYIEIKQTAETMLGLKTQCIKDDNVVKKCNPALISNLCQKINAKMGGINNSLTPGETPPVLNKPVIIIGADVTHPGPSLDIKPSLAAAVGSIDRYVSRYAVTCRAQTNIDKDKKSIEIILDLKSMIVELLKAFYRATRKKPEKIIFYRDGVSEGQFEKVQEHEVKCIREACKSLEQDYQPGITFIIVQKRHHVRFMPQDPRDGVHKMKNIPPGTAVDNTVTHPLNFDFFLCSHLGLQGTSRPCHYTVIEDDNKFTADDLQILTYYLCHTYVRCTKSISAPAPVQYAHLAAFRARQHLLAQMDESSASSDVSSATFRPLPENMINAIKVVDVMKDTMYFV